MIALVLTLAAFALPQSPASARFDVEPREVEIGEPVAWTLTIEHASGAKVQLPESDPELDLSWTYVEGRRVRKERDAADPARAITRVSWTVIALEPGERTLPSWVVQCEDASGALDVTADGVPLSVRAALAPGEDAPRPMRGPLPPPEPEFPLGPLFGEAPGRWLAGIVVLGGIVYFVLRRRRRVAPVAREPAPLERLAALRARVASAAGDREVARESVYAASQLLRASIDAHRGVRDAAATDPEWLKRIERDERVPAGVKASAARVLASAESVKYALHVPTPFALEETLKDVEAALGALSQSPALPVKEVA